MKFWFNRETKSFFTEKYVFAIFLHLLIVKLIFIDVMTTILRLHRGIAKTKNNLIIAGHRRYEATRPT